jgi:hypothetical protein
VRLPKSGTGGAGGSGGSCWSCGTGLSDKELNGNAPVSYLTAGDEIVLDDGAIVGKWLKGKEVGGGVLWLRVTGKIPGSRQQVHNVAEELGKKGYVLFVTTDEGVRPDKLMYVSDLSGMPDSVLKQAGVVRVSGLSGLSDDELKSMGLMRYDFSLEDKVISEICPA